MNEFVGDIVNLAKTLENIVQMLVEYPLSILSQNRWRYLSKVRVKYIVGYLQWRRGKSSPWRLWLWCICIQGMGWLSYPPHNTHPYANALSHLILCFGNGVVVILQWTTLKNYVFGWAFWSAGTRKCEQGTGGLGIVSKWQRGDRASRCCSWNPTSSNAKTSSHVSFVPPFTCHTIDPKASKIHEFFLELEFLFVCFLYLWMCNLVGSKKTHSSA